MSADKRQPTSELAKLRLERIKERGFHKRLEALCKDFHCTVDEVVMSVNRKNVAEARRQFFQEVYKALGSYSAAGFATGFDHTAIMYAVKKRPRTP